MTQQNKINIINVILEQSQFNHIKLKSYTNNSLDIIIYFLIDNITIKILTDFNNYCIGESDNKNIKLFNINIIFLEKTPINIITELNNLLYNHDNNEIADISELFNFNNSLETISKYNIDYNLIKKNMDKFYSNNLLSNILSNKDIIFNKKEIINIVVNELKKINKNMDYNHYIVINYDEPNIFIIRYMFNKELQKKINNFFGHEYVEIKLNIKFYPYFPPKIEYSKPLISNDLLIGILDIDILKFINWNSVISIEYLLINLGNELEKVIDNHIIYNLKCNKLNYELLKLSHLLKYSTNKIKININNNYDKISKKNASFGNGTGYGGGTLNSSKWDIKNYIKEKEIINTNIYNYLLNIYTLLNTDNINILLESYFINYINETLQQLTLLELHNNKDTYIILFDIIEIILNNNENKNIYFINIINLYNEINIIDNINNNEFKYILKIKNICEIINKNNILSNNTNDIINEEEVYIKIMKDLQYDFYEINNRHLFYDMINNKPSKKALSRILTELGSLKTSLPLNWNSTIWIRISKNNFNLFSFIISGPQDTPYENGLFEFHAYFPNDYPNEVPKVLLKTTGNQTVRFNPNLYNTGKVCLSLLGTWDGQDSEKWNPETSTFIQVIISIQSLILVDDPYFNEPSYQSDFNTTRGLINSLKYNFKLYPNTIKYGMIEMLESPPNGYETVIKEYFKHKKDNIIKTVTEWETLYITFKEEERGKLNEIEYEEFLKNKEKLINILNNL